MCVPKWNIVLSSSRPTNRNIIRFAGKLRFVSSLCIQSLNSFTENRGGGKESNHEDGNSSYHCKCGCVSCTCEYHGSTGYSSNNVGGMKLCGGHYGCVGWNRRDHECDGEDCDSNDEYCIRE